MLAYRQLDRSSDGAELSHRRLTDSGSCGRRNECKKDFEMHGGMIEQSVWQDENGNALWWEVRILIFIITDCPFYS